MIQKNWQDLIKPQKLDVQPGRRPDREATIVVEPLERGFGITLGNAIRRVLLSSLQGAAITAIQIDGVLHEFSTIPGVREDESTTIYADHAPAQLKKPEAVAPAPPPEMKMEIKPLPPQSVPPPAPPITPPMPQPLEPPASPVNPPVIVPMTPPVTIVPTPPPPKEPESPPPPVPEKESPE